MTDIVERIRKYALQSNDGYLRGPALDAANEIERLRHKHAELEATSNKLLVTAESA